MLNNSIVHTFNFKKFGESINYTLVTFHHSSFIRLSEIGNPIHSSQMHNPFRGVAFVDVVKMSKCK